MMPSRLPRCRLSAVGSKPQYTVRAPAPAAFSSASLVVSCVTKMTQYISPCITFSLLKTKVSGRVHAAIRLCITEGAASDFGLTLCLLGILHLSVRF